MIEPNLAPAGTTATDASARVLVCSVDRGLFGIQAAWVEAVYPTASMTVHTTRTDACRWPASVRVVCTVIEAVG